MASVLELNLWDLTVDTNLKDIINSAQPDEIWINCPLAGSQEAIDVAIEYLDALIVAESLFETSSSISFEEAEISVYPKYVARIKAVPQDPKPFVDNLLSLVKMFDEDRNADDETDLMVARVELKDAMDEGQEVHFPELKEIVYEYWPDDEDDEEDD